VLDVVDPDSDVRTGIPGASGDFTTPATKDSHCSVSADTDRLLMTWVPAFDKKLSHCAEMSLSSSDIGEDLAVRKKKRG
jgi:hypothetical protein